MSNGCSSAQILVVQARSLGFESCRLLTLLLHFFSSSLQLLTEQEKALKERIRDLEAANAENKMDPTHLAKLEKQVQQFQKGELDYTRGSCSQVIPIGRLFFPLVT